jgi:hypothetical protein
MNRRHFLVGAAGCALVNVSAAAYGGNAAVKRTSGFSTYITNLRDVLGQDQIPLLPGEPLLLVRERMRGYDPDSIGVTKADGLPVGYLPSNQTKVLARVMDAGVPVSASVTRVKRSPTPTVHVDVHIGTGPRVGTG